MNKPEFSEGQMVKLGMQLIFIFVLTVILSITSCTMHSNTYDPARIKETAVIEQYKTDRLKINIKLETEKVATIARLIEEGNNPVAVRCAVEKWKDADACENIGLIIGDSRRVK